MHPWVRAELGEVHVVLPEWVLGPLVLSRWGHHHTLGFSWVKTHIFVQHRKKQVRKCST